MEVKESESALHCRLLRERDEAMRAEGRKEVAKWIEKSSNNWQATTFNDQVDNKEPYLMMTLEIRTSKWQAKLKKWGVE